MLTSSEVEKSLDVTTSLILASIQSGKFEAKDGEAVAEFLDKVFAMVCECTKLTSPKFIEKYAQERSKELSS